MKFELDESMVREALQVALLKVLEPAKRDELVGEAVRRLLEGGWQTPSDMQRIFRSAAENVAREIARAELDKPENRERIRSLVVEAWEKALTGDKKDALVDRIAEKIAAGFVGDRY